MDDMQAFLDFLNRNEALRRAIGMQLGITPQQMQSTGVGYMTGGSDPYASQEAAMQKLRVHMGMQP
jgi:hypothetical protein